MSQAVGIFNYFDICPQFSTLKPCLLIMSATTISTIYAATYQRPGLYCDSGSYGVWIYLVKSLGIFETGDGWFAVCCG